MSDDPTYLARLEPILEGLRKAGAARTMTAARRLAAILAADVVGYSRLMGEDEAGTARAFSEHREDARPNSSTRASALPTSQRLPFIGREIAFVVMAGLLRVSGVSSHDRHIRVLRQIGANSLLKSRTCDILPA